MTRSRLLLLIAFTIFIAKGCSTIKRSDYEEKVMTYMKQFELNLSSSDEIILDQFHVAGKDDEVILKAIRIMQNKELGEDSILCTVNFKNPAIVFEEVDIRVEIKSILKSIDPNYTLEKEATFTLWLTSDNGDLSITNIDADQFYFNYQNAVRDLSNRKNREKDLASKKIFFNQARILQQSYDSVVWFTQYKDSIYYYVVNGTFENYFLNPELERPTTYKMGLVGEKGNVIVPPEYELVGTIGFSTEGIVEAKRNGLVGHFNLQGKEVVPAVYKWIIPYQHENTYALVKQDTVNGWLDKSYAFHPGFPDEAAMKYIQEFRYLSDNINISQEYTTMTEILDPENMGFGIAMPAAHLVDAGVFKEIIPRIYMGENSLGWGDTEYIKTRGSFFERITENISALFVMIEGSYLGGREEFYRVKNLTFVDEHGRSMGGDRIYSGRNTVKQIDSTLFELDITATAEEASDYWDMGEDATDWNPPQYQYFVLSRKDNKVLPLKSNRQFAFTQYIKIDSSYLKGGFVYWDSVKNEISIREFVCDATLQDMRNEILAAYGFKFTDPRITERFQYRDWYVPRHIRYEDFLESMTEVDRFNLEFLEKMIGTLNNPSGA